MFVDQWSKVVSASVAPVVIISASSLLCLAFYNRLAAIVTRLRAVQRERLFEQQAIEKHQRAAGGSNGPSGDSTEEGLALLRHRRILSHLDEQTPRILRRARLIRTTLLCLLGTIASLVLSSILNGLTIIIPSGVYAAAFLFLVGMVLLLAAVMAAMSEMLVALDPVELESDFVSQIQLEGDFASGLATHRDPLLPSESMH